MNSSMNGAAVRHHPPPRVVPSSRIITQKPLPTSSSIQVSKMAARDRAQSWRGKYLRALNICPEDIELARRKAAAVTPTGEGASKGRLRTLSYSRGDFPERNSMSRSYSSSTEKEDEQRKSLERLAQQQQQHHVHNDDHSNQQRIHAVPLRAIPVSVPTATASASNPYGFAIRPELARGRRCHTEPFALRERVSAPIQIPSIRSGVSTQLDGNDRTLDNKTSMLTGQRIPFGNNNHTVGLLSWEDPVAMRDDPTATKGWHVPVNGDRREQALPFAFDEHVMHDDEEDVEDDDDHGGDIFEMEGLHDSSEDDENQTSNHQAPVSAKSRRRFRTASLNIASNGREKRVHRPAFGDEDTEDAPMGHMMSQSFVPPHQLVQRDCFSIGMRDEFKRRPTNNI